MTNVRRIVRPTDGIPGRVRAYLQEWFWRGSALRAATAQLQGPSKRAFEQARLLREVVKQVAEPFDSVRGGHRPAVVLGLCREWVYWMLVDGSESGGPPALDLRSVWLEMSDERLRRAAGGEINLEAVRRTLVELSPQEALDVGDEDVARVRAFAESLYHELQAPFRRVDCIRRQRRLRMGALAVPALAVLLALHSLNRGPNLIVGRTFQTSSAYPGCSADTICGAQLFHTKEQDNPWVEFDLGAVKRVHIVELENRTDCCQERAIPLVIEVSTDHKAWKEVARQEEDFQEWEATFPRTPARYVRLRVPRKTVFHLHTVKIR
jgi:hypothetical protein